ncbi:MAG: carboxypeptidase [Sphaerochaeta sp.]|jgi:carboxypeptidase PM20D1|nr:carboxypeptidase [Sphaerochaeta sp.]
MLFLLLSIFLLLFLVALVCRTAILRIHTNMAIMPSHVQTGTEAEAILSKAVACRTVSHAEPDQTDWDEFSHLIALLEKSFPLCNNQRIINETIGPYNLVYCFKGVENDREPALLTAHLDVVGATEHEWTYPPFEGHIGNGYLYGRGSFDCKLQVISILATFEHILKTKKPVKNTWYVAFGCDEESNSSKEGAVRIAQYFQSKGLHFSFVLDEGGVVSQEYIKGFAQSIAVVGVAEKGYLDLELSVERNAGHSSTPTFPTALGTLSQAVSRLERKQMPARLTPSVKQMLTNLGKEGPFAYSLLFLNLWLTAGLLKLVFSKQATLNAVIRSTIVPTVISASDKSNVIAKKATAIVNCRLLPGDTQETIVSWVTRTIASGSVMVTPLHCTPPSHISKADGDAFRFLSEAIKITFPESIVTPYLMMGATDARKYQDLSDAIYRFTPARMNRSEVDRMHAPDERISLENITLAQQFYAHVITNW